MKMLTLPTNTRLVETAIHERRKRKESMSGVTLPELEEPWLNYAPTQFDEHYECKEKIGEGAHGIVRRCVHKETGK